MTVYRTNTSYCHIHQSGEGGMLGGKQKRVGRVRNGKWSGTGRESGEGEK